MKRFPRRKEWRGKGGSTWRRAATGGCAHVEPHDATLALAQQSTRDFCRCCRRLGNLQGEALFSSIVYRDVVKRHHLRRSCEGQEDRARCEVVSGLFSTSHWRIVEVRRDGGVLSFHLALPSHQPSVEKPTLRQEISGTTGQRSQTRERERGNVASGFEKWKSPRRLATVPQFLHCPNDALATARPSDKKKLQHERQDPCRVGEEKQTEEKGARPGSSKSNPSRLLLKL